MTDDATLSDFVPTDEEEVDETRDAEDALEATPGDSGFSTYAWGEYTCGRCGAATERVWRDDGDFVCPECKEW
ncbi:DUF7573 domain-containing protein [Natrinema marinum]|uniref:DUF7573 domain-containing protein n=1 Tax=Natrinema marinum TaxID=2961598 RepID=UPI0020C86B52|nr:hypothetical protein [Natrinema marinum]